ncbi:MAG: hypothetical protein N2B06_10550 [Clostridium sp.]
MAALSATMSDFTIMIGNSGELAISSNKMITKEEEKYIETKMYSSANNCSESGSIQIVAKTWKCINIGGINIWNFHIWMH